ncbi:lysylphosphatidylglycerol synthase transmembrane domain-containing protein [Chitinispirillales bacterium ANBcel5]|uniref:lysylphosphatidylglycerol synthase transmembrane domain-containing protein n=1 Tax=Cellulosispirillum alkaliphilum TaxID=3039283 RepID=UPI002A575BBE|nr:lysylphosphatidylglycerol synthase transmembrane domain-containing protein [Chitinispirillales bacterium ANBcel5]
MSTKATIVFLLKAVLTIAPFVWIYAQTNIHDVLRIVKTVPVHLLFLVIFFSFLIHLSQGVKWWFLLRRFNSQIPLRETLKVHLLGSFYSIAFPTSAAQDLLRAALLSRSHPGSQAWASSWMSRFIGLFALLVLSTWGTAMLDSTILPPGFRSSLFTVFAMVAFIGAISFSKKITRPVRKVVSKVISPKPLSFIENIREGVYAYKSSYSTLLGSFFISAAIHLLIIANTTFLIYIITGNFFFLECLAFIPLIEILSISLPLTPGGIGVREALIAIMFRQLELGPDHLGSYVLISLLCYFLPKVTGSLLLIPHILRRKQ